MAMSNTNLRTYPAHCLIELMTELLHLQFHDGNDLPLGDNVSAQLVLQHRGLCQFIECT